MAPGDAAQPARQTAASPPCDRARTVMQMEAGDAAAPEKAPVDARATVRALVEFALARPGARHDEFRGQSAICIQTMPFMLSGDHGVVLLRLAPSTQARFVRRDPTGFCAAEGRFGRVGWTRIQVRRVPMAALEGLVREAHQLASSRYRPRR